MERSLQQQGSEQMSNVAKGLHKQVGLVWKFNSHYGFPFLTLQLYDLRSEVHHADQTIQAKGKVNKFFITLYRSAYYKNKAFLS